ncbi:MAG: ATP-binding protein [Planctomycetota bacterium]
MGPAFSADWSESALARVPPRHDNQRLTRFLSFMRAIQVCGLYPRSFLAESRSEDPTLARDGSNFSAWYRHILQERQDLVPSYHQALAEVIDTFHGIRLEKVGMEARAFVVILEDNGHRYELRLDELSDGQRALNALYALVHITADQGYVLFLDEPDNYVALPEIQPWLMAVVDACGQSIPQVVICSHHPELIDYLGAERGLLLEREASGVVTARELAVAEKPGGLKLSELVARGWER